jgi:hypothetical protein
MAYAQHSRTDLLNEIAGLPDFTCVTAKHAAAMIDTTPAVLANWRSARRGPRFVRNGDFIRYQIGALKAFIQGRDRMEWGAPPAESKPQDAREPEPSTA